MSTYLVGPPPEAKDCPQCDHVCQSTVDSQKLAEVHAWLAELMPAARVAIKLLDKRDRLLHWGRTSAK